LGLAFGVIVIIMKIERFEDLEIWKDARILK